VGCRNLIVALRGGGGRLLLFGSYSLRAQTLAHRGDEVPPNYKYSKLVSQLGLNNKTALVWRTKHHVHISVNSDSS
jgi:hypothetical protein